MNKIVQDITLDFNIKPTFQCVQAKQGDNSSRFLRVTLANNGKIYKPPSGMMANFRAQKPDKSMVINNCSIDNDGIITVELTQQTLAVCGEVLADLYLTDVNGHNISTNNFIINVVGAPNGADIISENEFLTLMSLIERAETAATNAVNSAQKAEGYSASAEQHSLGASTYAEQAEKSKIASEKAMRDASYSAQTAIESARSAANEAVAAGKSESNARASEESANDSKIAAGNSEANAKTSEANAASYAGQAETSKSESAKSATDAANSANEANNSAASSSQSATNAETSATNAKKSETSSADFAKNARTSSEAASSSATSADNSARAAKESENNANSSKATAETAASNAKSSAQSARESATSARQSAVSAEESAKKAVGVVHVGDDTPPEGTKVIVHPNGSTVKIPTELSELNSDENHQTVTQLEKDAWNNKQPKGDYATTTALNDLEIRIIDKICCLFHEKGSVVQGELVDGYPLHVISHITPWQEGSGDPSPTNVRPIHGCTELNLTKCGTNLLNQTVFYWKDRENIQATRNQDGSIHVVANGKQAKDWINISNIKYSEYSIIGVPNKEGFVAKDCAYNIAGNITYITIQAGEVIDKVYYPQICYQEFSPYTPYSGETYTKKLPEEVFDAAFNWGNGKLQLRSKLFTLRVADMNNSENSPGWANISGLQDVVGTKTGVPVKIMCNVGKVSVNQKYSILFLVYSGLTQSQWKEQYPDMTVQILVEYLENLRPTIQFQPEPDILALDGATTLYSNAGNTEVIGRSDTGSLITSLSNRIAALEKSKVNI